MPLNDEPTVDFIKTINRRTKVPLNLNELILSPTYPTDDPKVSQLRLTTKSEGSYGGSEILTYKRLNLAYLDTLLFRRPNLYPKSNNLYENLEELENGIGIRLTTEDVHDAPIEEDGGVFRVTLKAKALSYRWYGEYQLEFQTLPTIDRLLEYVTVEW